MPTDLLTGNAFNSLGIQVFSPNLSDVLQPFSGGFDLFKNNPQFQPQGLTRGFSFTVEDSFYQLTPVSETQLTVLSFGNRTQTSYVDSSVFGQTISFQSLTDNSLTQVTHTSLFSNTFTNTPIFF